ncbi:unnamed protein product [Prunus brigantina]
MVMSCITSMELEVLINGKTGPTLSHIFFSNDSLFCLKATAQNCRVIEIILQCYCQASRQLVKFQKSNMFFSPNTPMPPLKVL